MNIIFGSALDIALAAALVCQGIPYEALQLHFVAFVIFVAYGSVAYYYGRDISLYILLLDDAVTLVSIVIVAGDVQIFLIGHAVKQLLGSCAFGAARRFEEYHLCAGCCHAD